jgi:hypothetical protein
MTPQAGSQQSTSARRGDGGLTLTIHPAATYPGPFRTDDHQLRGRPPGSAVKLIRMSPSPSGAKVSLPRGMRASFVAGRHAGRSGGRFPASHVGSIVAGEAL